MSTTTNEQLRRLTDVLVQIMNSVLTQARQAARGHPTQPWAPTPVAVLQGRRTGWPIGLVWPINREHSILLFGRVTRGNIELQRTMSDVIFDAYNQGRELLVADIADGVLELVDGIRDQTADQVQQLQRSQDLAEARNRIADIITMKELAQ